MTRPAPNPRPLDETAATRWPERRLRCRYYLECLDVAADANWPSWDCSGCEVREDATDEPVALLHALDPTRGRH